MFFTNSQNKDSFQDFIIPGLFALCCLLVVPIGTLGFDLPKLWAFSAFALAGGLWTLRSGRHPLRALLHTWSGRLLLLCSLYLLLSFAWSTMPIVSLLGMPPRYLGSMSVGVGLTLLLWSQAMCKESDGLRTVLRSLVISNALVCLYGLLQVLHLDPLGQLFDTDAFLGRVFSTMGHPNSLGQFILLTGPFVGLRSFTGKRPSDRSLYAALLILNFVILLATASRGVLLALILTLMLVTQRYGQRMRGFTERQQAGTAIVLVGILVIGAASFASRFAVVFEQGRSLGARTIIYEESLRMLRDRPWGYGLETMSFYSPRYIGPDIYNYESLVTTVDRAHNVLLDLGLSVGILGIVLYGAAMAWMLRSGWLKNSSLTQVSVTSLLGFHVALLFSFPAVATIMVSWVVMGVLFSQLSSNAKGTVSKVQSWVLMSTLLLVTAGALVASSLWIGARLAQAKAQWHVGQGNSTEGIATYTEAVTLFPYDVELLRQAAETHLQLMQLVVDPVLTQNTNTIINQLLVLTSRQDGLGWLLKAWYHANLGQTADMETALGFAREQLPYSIPLKRGEALVYRLVNNEEAAKAAEQQIVRWLPEAFYTDAETQRILLKQHEWLQQLVRL